MKKIASTLLFGKDARFSGLIAFAIVGAIALGCTCNKEFGSTSDTPNSSNTSTTTNTTTTTASPAPKADASTGQVPTEAQLQDIARATLLDFNDAIQSGDFTKFHGTVSKPFQKQATAERMEDAFRPFIEAKIDLSEIRTLPASFTTSSINKISRINHLQLTGSYNTSPRPAKFNLKYIPEGKDWKLISIEVNTKDEPLTTNALRDPSSSSTGITMGNFSRLKTGMTYEEVVEILGKEGEVLSETDIAGTKTVMYKWDGEDGYGANMNAMFQNGKLMSKSQYGLK